MSCSHLQSTAGAYVDPPKSFDISFSDLLIWNPEINAACDSAYSPASLPKVTILMFHYRPRSCGMALIIATTCTRSANGEQSYCVHGSNPCTIVYQVQSGDYCSEIETQLGITHAQLTSLNPWLDSNCGKFVFHPFLFIPP